MDYALITLSNIDQFRNHFGRLHDALVESIHYNITEEVKDGHLTIILNAPFKEPGNKPQYRKLSLLFKGVESLIIIKSINTLLGLILKSEFEFKDHSVALHFNRYSGESPNDPISSVNTRFSISSREIYWHVGE